MIARLRSGPPVRECAGLRMTAPVVARFHRVRGGQSDLPSHSHSSAIAPSPLCCSAPCTLATSLLLLLSSPSIPLPLLSLSPHNIPASLFPLLLLSSLLPQPSLLAASPS